MYTYNPDSSVSIFLTFFYSIFDTITDDIKNDVSTDAIMFKSVKNYEIWTSTKMLLNNVGGINKNNSMGIWLLL